MAVTQPRSREVFCFHRPETLKEWMVQGISLRERLHHIPLLNPDHLPARELHLRDCQEIAIINLEASFKADRPRALIQNGNRRGQNLHRHHLNLPPAQICGCQAHSVSWSIPKILASKLNRK